jgi:hypothetical protein
MNITKKKICTRCNKEHDTFRTKYCPSCTAEIKYHKTQDYQIELAEKEYGPLYKFSKFIFYNEKITLYISTSKHEKAKFKFVPYYYKDELYFQLTDNSGNLKNEFVKNNNFDVKYEIKASYPKGIKKERMLVKTITNINDKIDSVREKFLQTIISEINLMDGSDDDCTEDKLVARHRPDRNAIYDICQNKNFKLIYEFNEGKNKIYDASTKTTNDEILGRTPIARQLKYNEASMKYKTQEDFRIDFVKYVRHLEIPVSANADLSKYQNSKDFCGKRYIEIIEKHMNSREIERFRKSGYINIIIAFIDNNKITVTDQDIYEISYYNRNYLKYVFKQMLFNIYVEEYEYA